MTSDQRSDQPGDELKIRDDQRVRVITLDRPASKNGLTNDLNQALVDTFADAASRAEIRAVVLTGAGGAFSSGLDFKWAAVHGFDRLDEQIERYFHGVVRAIRACPKPVIALVDGVAAGFGCDLALACDIRVATPRARFGEIFVRRGLMPDGGGTFHLARQVGLGNALYLLFTGDMVDAEEARRLGLVSKIWPEESAAAETMALARRLAAGAPRALALIKRAVYGALDGTLEEALAVEKRGQVELIGSRDFLEGVSAFLAKREPDFTGE